MLLSFWNLWAVEKKLAGERGALKAASQVIARVKHISRGTRGRFWVRKRGNCGSCCCLKPVRSLCLRIFIKLRLPAASRPDPHLAKFVFLSHRPGCETWYSGIKVSHEEEEVQLSLKYLWSHMEYALIFFILVSLLKSKCSFCILDVVVSSQN